MGVSFRVYGVAQPAGSKKAIVRGGRALVIDDNAKATPWKKRVAEHAALAIRGRDPLEGALVFRAEFHLPRPKGHLGARGLVKPSAPARPIVRPDVLKLARAVEDALTGVVYADDAQIVTEVIEKHYALSAPYVDVAVEVEELAEAVLF